MQLPGIQVGLAQEGEVDHLHHVASSSAFRVTRPTVAVSQPGKARVEGKQFLIKNVVQKLPTSFLLAYHWLTLCHTATPGFKRDWEMSVAG